MTLWMAIACAMATGTVVSIVMVNCSVAVRALGMTIVMAMVVVAVVPMVIAMLIVILAVALIMVGW